ncbi:MAG: protease complex subunit PrcB family protein [Bacteroidota bacterium]
MIKKIVLCAFALIVVACGSTGTKKTEKPLFEILTQQKDGGGNINFYEIVSEKGEYNMLLGDKHLKGKIKPNDITTATFVILNMGEKSQAGSSIDVVSAEETPTSIILVVKENEPQTIGPKLDDVIYPYTIVKVNSKKEIIIK